MIVNILDRQLQMIDIVDDAKSVIWTKRFQDCGDFEIYMIATKKNLKKFQQGYFLAREDDDTVMIVEKIQITTDIENGNFLTVSGRSIESLFERRCMTEDLNRGHSSGNRITTIFSQVAVAMSNGSDDDPENMDLPAYPYYQDTLKNITSPKTNVWNTELIYADFLQILKDECKKVNVGFKLYLFPGTSSYYKLAFDAILSVDRSVDQSERPQVVFSREYDNLIASNYSLSHENYKNGVVVFGEGEGYERKKVVIYPEGKTGLDLYMIPIDARDLSSKTQSGGTLPEEEYRELLIQRGLSKLSELNITEVFEGEIQADVQWKYKKDYFLGDIVTLENEYGIRKNVRISEVVECEDNTGYYYIPKFESVGV